MRHVCLRSRVRGIGAALATLALAGCAAVGPDYARPDSTLPAQYPASMRAAAHAGAEASARDALPASDRATAPEVPDWWTRFADPKLDALVETALSRNTDVLAAIARIEEADAVMREVNAGFLPTVNAGASGTRSQTSGMTAQRMPVLSNNLRLSASTAYEIDFWGKLRRGSEAARAQALASRNARDVVALSIAGLTTQSYFALRSLDEQIAVTRRTLETRDEGLRIARARLDAGTTSRLDVEQASASRSDAAIQLRDLQRQRSLAATQLARLVGEPGMEEPAPGAAPASALSSLPVPPEPPIGLPSDLLVRRPDVRQAEEQLVAANAQIGVARAAMLPSISLTGSLGGESTALASLLDAGARIWSLGFGLSLPIFDAGRLEARSDQASARARQAVAAYQGAAQNAFRDVADALIAARAARDSETDLRERADTARRSLELARMRYDAGYSGYLELLDAQRTANVAELELVRNRQARLNASIDLFKALSGGWPEQAHEALSQRRR